MEQNANQGLTLLDVLPEPVLAAEDGIITFENQAARRLLVEELTGMPAAEIFDPGLLMTASGEAAGAVRLGRGLYAVHTVEREGLRLYTLKLLPEDSDASRKALSLFTTHIRSGVGTALTAISLMHERLDGVPPGFAISVARSDKSACIMARMADNFARMFCGMDSEPQPAALDLRRLVRDVAATVTELTAAERPAIVCDCGPGLIPAVADGRLLELALMHLLSNAIKYAGPESTVTVSVKHNKTNLWITVSDDGRGVRPELLGDVFNAYASPARELEPQAGVGLGLGIVQRIAVMHGGSAVMESTWGHGASVTVRLPRITPPSATRLRADYKNDVSAFLIQLSDILPVQAYIRRDLM